MVYVSTLFHRVDEFEYSDESLPSRLYLLDPKITDQFIDELLGQVLFDPGPGLVKKILSEA
ncbi:MAG: hypothetical protein CSA96_02865 [Bacteroidetes bacterium]|nr:MAG: hypothetical protein CSA96_02865 [Bacteroidota bacterium]